jgi:hypothetical protein
MDLLGLASKIIELAEKLGAYLRATIYCIFAMSVILTGWQMIYGLSGSNFEALGLSTTLPMQTFAASGISLIIIIVHDLMAILKTWRTQSETKKKKEHEDERATIETDLWITGIKTKFPSGWQFLEGKILENSGESDFTLDISKVTENSLLILNNMISQGFLEMTDAKEFNGRRVVVLRIHEAIVQHVLAENVLDAPIEFIATDLDARFTPEQATVIKRHFIKSGIYEDQVIISDTSRFSHDVGIFQALELDGHFRVLEYPAGYAGCRTFKISVNPDLRNEMISELWHQPTSSAA